ncbi:uncharacterized protein LOC129777982 isoform X2 [Toxorhynchites rutilus septentrionalis]|nr:uncharacterized protein LOC129777982 isoform X2 [Toxorhynchites rutilus septentrionalis]XP_055640574.1 uncharacterized protein LOC129777982 isoform X2 [Toxorhynchites rutilus septentrionalis]XP_055640575.1 uncharacterized protein LOC129777982 isoform X2 [Toxorhynchites rutilus septentrionalis]
MTYEKMDTFYDLDRIYATIERMLVLIRQLSGVSRLGESGRSLSLELQLLNTIDEKSYQVQELQTAGEYLFGQFKIIYTVNKELYTQLNKRGSKIFELDQQLREQGKPKCLYYMADVIKYEPALLAMQKVLDRTMREIRILKNQRNNHKLELCVSHIRKASFDKAFDELFSFENSIEYLLKIIEQVLEGSIWRLVNILQFLKGYYLFQKSNSENTFVVGCELLVQHLKSIVLFRRVETLMIYSLINDVLNGTHHLEDFSRDRLQILVIDLSANKTLAVNQIQNDPDESSSFAKLFDNISEDLLRELIRLSYRGCPPNLKNILKFIHCLPSVDHDILCYRELYSEMLQMDLSRSHSIFALAHHIRMTMQHRNYAQAIHASELDELKSILPQNVCSIIWKHVFISRHESRVLMKFSGAGKEVGFTRYTADKNRFEFEPVDEGNSFRIRNVATNAYLVEIGGRPTVVGSNCDASDYSGHWKLLPHENCTFFRIANSCSGRYLYSKFSVGYEYDFYSCPEILCLTDDETVLSEGNSYWKIEDFSLVHRRDSECVML